MKKLIIFFIVGMFAWAPFVDAGMIDYDRREKMQKKREAQELTTLQGVIVKIADEKKSISIKGQDEKELTVTDRNLVKDFYRGQTVKAIYNMRTNILKELILVAE